MDSILVVSAVLFPVLPGLISNFIFPNIVTYLFMKTPVLEFVFTMLYLVNMWIKERYDRITFGIGCGCAILTCIPILLLLGGIYYLFAILLLTASICLYLFSYLFNFMYSPKVTLSRKSGTFILFYILGAIFLLV